MKLLPVIRLKFRIFYTLLRPILVPSADVILSLLEEDQFISNTLFDKNTAGMLSNDRLFVLEGLLAIYVAEVGMKLP